MTAHRALTVTTDNELRSDCTSTLTELGFSVTAVPDGRLAMEAARMQQPHLVLVGNGDGDGDVGPLLHAMRRHFNPLLVVVDKNHSSQSEIRSWGADKVLIAPWESHELHDELAQLRTAPQPDRIPTQWPERWEFGALGIDVGAREVTVNDLPVALTRTEFDLLTHLAETPRRVISRDQLIESVWGLDWYSDGHLLDVHIGNLRQKIGESGRSQRFIETVRGVGFRFNPEPEAGTRTPRLESTTNPHLAHALAGLPQAREGQESTPASSSIRR